MFDFAYEIDDCVRTDAQFTYDLKVVTGLCCHRWW